MIYSLSFHLIPLPCWVHTQSHIGAIYPNKVVSEPGYDKQWQKMEAEQKHVKIIEDRRNKVQAEYHVLELQPKGHFQNQCSKLVASKDKEVSMEARDSDDLLVCCVKNMAEDHIMDSGASFHATYCKEELDSWTLKDVRYISGLKRRLISVRQLDEEGYYVGFGDQHWKVTKGSLVVAPMIGMHMLASKGNVPDVRRVDIYFCKPGGLGKQKKLSFIMSEKTRKLQRGSKDVMGSTTYLIYRIPYVLLGLRILEEEWRGKDTSLANLKVFGYDSFVKVKDVCGEAMKCTFIGSGIDEVRYSFQDTKSHRVIRSRDITFIDSIYEARSATDSSGLTKPIHKSRVVLVDIPENYVENDSIVAEHGLSSKIT
ncbi:retrovirus-related pol polyprotein from transposon TNT 1-94 [Tanacetum coccineum]